MTYITPDDIALKKEAERYWNRFPQASSFAGGSTFRGAVMPMLSEAPLPPFVSKQRTVPNRPKLSPRGTYSPFDEGVTDPRGEQNFLGDDAAIQAMATTRANAAADIAAPTGAITGTVIASAIVLYYLFRR